MECNKDDAIRAKQLAEKKLLEKDIAGAKRFASKAQSLFPGLEGLSQFQEILDVYVASERKVNGEVDWYGIIGADPLADDDTVRNTYRKLALSLHPDKNKCVGADGAFKLLSEAWSFLSDKAKKAAYDQNQNVNVSRDNFLGSNPGAGAMKNGSKKARMSSSKYPATHDNVERGSGFCQSNPRTFWTSCRRCNVQYEYLIMYLNQNLICPSCRFPFLAKEMPPPSSAKINNSSSVWPSNHQQQGAKKRFNSTSYLKRKFSSTTKEVYAPQGSSSTAGGARSVPGPTGAASQPADSYTKNLNRVHENFFAGTVDEVAPPRKKSALKKTYSGLASENAQNSRKEVLAKKRRLNEQSALGSEMPCSLTEEAISSVSKGNNSVKDFCPPETNTVLMEAAKFEISKKLKEWRMTASLKTMKGKTIAEKNYPMQEDTEESISSVTKKAGNMTGSFGEIVQSRISPFSLLKIDELSESVPAPDQLKGSNLSALTPGSVTKATGIMLTTVPEFYDFDKDRSDESFGENQVWALYDATDGMPRYYALIHGLISKDPIEVQISWLNLKSDCDLSWLKWFNFGIPRTCGDFRVGKCEVIKNLICFSHRVKCSKGARGLILIYPKKGDIWVLYRNWSSDWNELTPDDVIRQYDLVEVLEDYDDEQGVLVVPLVKVAAFKAVFHQHLDQRTIYTIPKEELFRFSHQIPSHILRSDIAKRWLEGCRELDPAAMPVEFLQVMREAEEEEVFEANDIAMLDEVSEGKEPVMMPPIVLL